MTSRALRWLEVTSFDRRSSGSCCRRPKACVYCTFHFLQGCSTQEEAVTWQEMTSRDLRWPQVTFDRKSPGSGFRKPQTRVYFIQGCNSQEEAVTCQEMTSVTSGDRNWPGVTSFNRKSPGSGCRKPKLASSVHFTSNKAVARRRQSPDRKWRHVTYGDRKWLGSDVIWWEITWKCCRRPKTRIHSTFHFLQGRSSGGGSHVTGNDVMWPQVTGSDPEVTSFAWKTPGSACRRPKNSVHSTFHFLQGCSLQEEAVTWQEMTSRDLRE